MRSMLVICVCGAAAGCASYGHPAVGSSVTEFRNESNAEMHIWAWAQSPVEGPEQSVVLDLGPTSMVRVVFWAIRPGKEPRAIIHPFDSSAGTQLSLGMPSSTAAEARQAMRVYVLRVDTDHGFSCTLDREHVAPSP